MGTVVVSGMLAATLLGIFFIPALFVLVERLTARGKQVAHIPAAGGTAAAPHAAARDEHASHHQGA
jgi:hypothetical protein